MCAPSYVTSAPPAEVKAPCESKAGRPNEIHSISSRVRIDEAFDSDVQAPLRYALPWLPSCCIVYPSYICLLLTLNNDSEESVHGYVECVAFLSKHIMETLHRICRPWEILFDALMYGPDRRGEKWWLDYPGQQSFPRDPYLIEVFYDGVEPTNRLFTF